MGGAKKRRQVAALPISAGSKRGANRKGEFALITGQQLRDVGRADEIFSVEQVLDIQRDVVTPPLVIERRVGAGPTGNREVVRRARGGRGRGIAAPALADVDHADAGAQTLEPAVG